MDVENKICIHMIEAGGEGACGQCYGYVVSEMQRLQRLIEISHQNAQMLIAGAEARSPHGPNKCGCDYTDGDKSFACECCNAPEGVACQNVDEYEILFGLSDGEMREAERKRAGHYNVCDERYGRDCNGAGCHCWCHR